MTKRTDLPPELLGGPFLVGRATELGVPAHVLRTGRFRQVFRGVYVAAQHVDSERLQLDAVRLVAPAAVGSHLTAARLRRLTVPDVDPRLHVTVPPPTAPRIDIVRGHVGPIGQDLRVVGGQPLMSVERTIADLAASRPPLRLVDLVILGDAAVRRGWTTVEHLRVDAAQRTGRGVRVARPAIDLVRAKVDSPMETRLRLLLVLAGLPEPSVNQPIHHMSGWLATPDLSYPQFKIAIEYDGDHHRADRRQWSEDRARRRILRDLGWDLLECVAADVYTSPVKTLRWVYERLLAAGHPDAPAVLSDQWRQVLGNPAPTASGSPKPQ